MFPSIWYVVLAFIAYVIIELAQRKEIIRRKETIRMKVAIIEDMRKLVIATKRYHSHSFDEVLIRRFFNNNPRRFVTVQYVIMEELWNKLGVDIDVITPQRASMRISNTGKFAAAIAKRLKSSGCKCTLKYDEETSNYILELTSPKSTTSLKELIWIVHDGMCAALDMEEHIKSTIFQHWRTRRTSAATNIQSAFRGWKTRKDNTWNPHSQFGRWVLAKNVADWIAEAGEMFS